LSSFSPIWLACSVAWRTLVDRLHQLSGALGLGADGDDRLVEVLDQLLLLDAAGQAGEFIRDDGAAAGDGGLKDIARLNIAAGGFSRRGLEKDRGGGAQQVSRANEPLDVDRHLRARLDDGVNHHLFLVPQPHPQDPADADAAEVNRRAIRQPVGAVGDDLDAGPLGEEELGGAVGELQDHPRQHPEGRQDDHPDQDIALVGGHGFAFKPRADPLQAAAGRAGWGLSAEFLPIFVPHHLHFHIALRH